MFQSHLRLIHPIHSMRSIVGICSVREVSIASAPHPPYPRAQLLVVVDGSSILVSIASAPHPPYPLSGRKSDSSRRAVSIASAPHPPYPLAANPVEQSNPGLGFQSHLRLIHPIHMPVTLRTMYHMSGFNRICASSTLSTSHMAGLKLVT